MMLVSCLYPNQIYRDAGREDVPRPGMYPLLVFNPGGGYSHTLRIRVCAAQRGRDFEARGLERGIHFRRGF